VHVLCTTTQGLAAARVLLVLTVTYIISDSDDLTDLVTVQLED
jgi:hypothetical protein